MQAHQSYQDVEQVGREEIQGFLDNFCFRLRKPSSLRCEMHFIFCKDSYISKHHLLVNLSGFMAVLKLEKKFIWFPQNFSSSRPLK